ncbi:MAG: hypothetical protein ACI86L_000837 [Dokdonia sp.]|jgi:hypothetical protein
MMGNLSFLRQEWLWPVMICAAFLWAVFLWKEYVQSGMRRFFLKAIVALVAVGSLTAMVLQPLLSEDRAKGVGVIPTQNYKQDQLDSLKSLHKGISVIAYDGNGFEKAQLDSISKAYVLGNGVASYDMWQLENIAITYTGGDAINGVVRLRYDQEPTLGDSLNIQGFYVKPAIGNRLVLEDAGGNGLDSIAFSEIENLSFSLQAKPKVAGQFIYRLVEKDSLHTIVSSDPLPLIVHPKSMLRILIINTFPTFETKYLKNFLAENGHELLVRSQLTQNKYKFENFNRKQGSISGFTRSNLADFDLVIIDAGSYLGLSSASKQALESQMEDEGLGVFIQSDASIMSDGKRFGFRFKRNTKTEMSLSQWPTLKIPVFTASFESDPLLQPILSSQNSVLSAYAQKGVGRLSTSMLNDTYQLVLDGNEAAYQYIWSTTLSAVSQKRLPIVRWEVESDLAYQDVPFRFKLRTSLPNPEVIEGLNNQIALRQNLQLPDQWEGRVYPRETGWNRLMLKQDSTMTMSYYVGDSEDWEHIKAYDLRQENQRVFAGSSLMQGVISKLKPVARWWFFVVFILAMGSLWVLPRIDSK